MLYTDFWSFVYSLFFVEILIVDAQKKQYSFNQGSCQYFDNFCMRKSNDSKSVLIMTCKSEANENVLSAVSGRFYYKLAIEKSLD